MKKNPFLLTFCIIFFIACTRKNVSKELPNHNFCGYGIIEFSKSYVGSVRYMVFYPMIESPHPDPKIHNKIKVYVEKGMIIRGTNSTDLWNDLIKNNNTKNDYYGYCKALIFLDLSKNTLKYNYSRIIPNEICIGKTIFKTKVFDYKPSFHEKFIKISNYKIIKSVR